jgi:DNA polymerase V
VAAPQAIFYFRRCDQRPRQNTLMAAVDQINDKLGRGTLRMAAEGFDHPWSTRFQYKSPRYTTCWEELPVAGAY